MLTTCSLSGCFCCRSRCRCGCRTIPTVNKEQFVGVLVIVDFVDARSGKVADCHRLIVVSQQRSCIPVSPYQYRECSSRTGRYCLAETDIETAYIASVTERMVRQLQSHVLRADRYGYRRKGIEISPSNSREQERKSCKKLGHIITPFLTGINPSSCYNHNRHVHTLHHRRKHRKPQHGNNLC